GLAAAAVFPVRVSPLGRHSQSGRSARHHAHRRRRDLRPDHHGEVLTVENMERQMAKPHSDLAGMDWLEAELADALHEDYELELSEPALSEEIRKVYKRTHPPTIDRADYFRHLLVLQSELIKLHYWVQHTKAKIVVLFEGRDSAGKGGVIKRITQR